MTDPRIDEHTAERQPSAARPLIVTADHDLLDDLLRLAAAAGFEVDVAHDAGASRRFWPAAPLVIVGNDLADELARQEPARRANVILASRDLDDAQVWRRAVALGAEQVTILPDGERWLTERFADVAAGAGPDGSVICVIGGRGGAGASTLATALALTAMRRGQRTMLLDGDPLGGGIDLVLGGERSQGSRWPDFASARGRVSADALTEALPRVRELSVLSWDRGDMFAIPGEAMRTVLAAARRAHELVVVDLPRRLDGAAEEALARCSVALLVVPAEVRAVAAARRVAAAVGMVAQDVRLVVRGPAPAGLPVDLVVDAMELPLAGAMRAEPGLAQALERGEPPARRGRGPLAEFCREFFDLLASETADEEATS